MAARKNATRKATKTKAPARAAGQATKRRKPESLRLRSLSAGMTVNDLSRSIDFYTRVLGFTPGERWEDGGQLKGLELWAGAVAIWLNQDDFAKGKGRVKGVGIRLYCNTSQDIDRLAAAITARGGKLDHEPQERFGGKDFGLTDPDGYKITFQSA